MIPQSKKNLIIYVTILIVIFIGVGIGIYFFVTNMNKSNNNDKSCNNSNKIICKMGSTAKCDKSTGYDWKCIPDVKKNCQGQHKTCTNTGDFVVCENNELKCVPFQKCSLPLPKCKPGQVPKCNGITDPKFTCSDLSPGTCQIPIDLPDNKQCTTMTDKTDCLHSYPPCIWVTNLKGACNSKMDSNYNTNQWQCLSYYDPQSCSQDSNCLWKSDD